ncbi:hypothetical protein PVV74_17275 [Roseovarius sp. SK2]|uniref:hypothetical protein n=1 Tax=Roseovarius TaxID=74030 RepID=UPI00237C4D5A|nr:hypothetical protein [Roseovarius sp. SK2]MDD9727215.1 hypothetical protein [Roseovarius sp. SK2]
MDDYAIEWQGTPQRDLDEVLREDLDLWLDGKPEGLVSHVMMVGGAEYGSDGPCVAATWCDHRQCIVAEFHQNAKWTTLEEILCGTRDEQ